MEIKVMDNAYFLVSGEFTLLDGEGNKMETREKAMLCRCGLSTTQPFCSGAHKGNFENTVRA
ncbi:CDGSH iron-sulfur domain-containing protein [Aneurinibacillus sp. BA2021]|nr:CDGSH iron-sulfur domain-containing protein [Aneurinibacillus sp. BA2021]